VRGILGWVVLLLPLALAACNEDTGVDCLSGPCYPPEHGPYFVPTAPESLIANLQVSYRRREIDQYAKILAPEFKFRFQPIDANIMGTDFWTRDQDSTGTRALLTTAEVADIRINLFAYGRDTTLNFPGTPLDTVKVRIVTTDLQVDQADGITWVVNDQQDLFFRKGLAALGENPNYWWMYAWNDLPSLSSAGAPRTTDPTPVAPTTWGKLKSQYGN
jgi:hypothetical protein